MYYLLCKTAFTPIYKLASHFFCLSYTFVIRVVLHIYPMFIKCFKCRSKHSIWTQVLTVVKIN